MIICPDCGTENIPGIDVCEQCGQSLSALSKPTASTGLELRLTKDRIETLQPKTPLTVTHDTPVREVLQLMVSNSVGCIFVMDGEELKGVFSERDALMRLGTEASLLSDRPISEFMTPSPVTLGSQDKIAFALHKMDLGGYRHVPIKTDDRLTGVISIRDILSYMTEHIAADA